MKFLVTGAAGFIGSSLVDRLLSLNHEVIGVDNFSTGIENFLAEANKNSRFKLITGDLLIPCLLDANLSGVDAVFHLAANADIRGGLLNPRKDIDQGIIVTFNVLESMRSSGVKKIIFASSAAALGEPNQFPTAENSPIPIQTSIYGAAKMACEGLVSSYCLGYGMEGYSFRFVSLLGPRYPHGHVYDFVKQLIDDPNNLYILGDGTQRKSYMHIQDCINAIIDIPINNQTAKKNVNNYEVYHLGSPEYCELNASISWICDEINIAPKLTYSGGDRGWLGDNPFVFLDVQKAIKDGWNPKNTIEGSVRETTRWLINNQWIFDLRK
jgi:UDP-glucose 4-epimerase